MAHHWNHWGPWNYPAPPAHNYWRMQPPPGAMQPRWDAPNTPRPRHHAPQVVPQPAARPSPAPSTSASSTVTSIATSMVATTAISTTATCHATSTCTATSASNEKAASSSPPGSPVVHLKDVKAALAVQASKISSKRKGTKKDVDVHVPMRKSKRLSASTKIVADTVTLKDSSEENDSDNGQKKDADVQKPLRKSKRLSASTKSVADTVNLKDSSEENDSDNGQGPTQRATQAHLNQPPEGDMWDWRPQKDVDPAMQESLEACITISDTKWLDVIGLEEVKTIMKEIIVMPRRRPDIFRGIRAPPRGVLLYGPPGTGKTMLAKCAASEGDFTFFSISNADITSKWYGESSKKVASLFALARKKSPSIIFIDEVDAVLSSRGEHENAADRRVKNQLLLEMDGVMDKRDKGAKVVVIGATNRPFDLDSAAIRRFERRVFVPLPDEKAREQIIKTQFLSGEAHENKLFSTISEEDYQELCLLTEGYSAPDLISLCREAAMMPLRETTNLLNIDVEDIDPITLDHVKRAMDIVRPSVTADSVAALKAWEKQA